MPTALKRVQMLLESHQHAMLARLAQQEGRSVADVTRQVIVLGLEQLAGRDDLARRSRALQRADELSAQIQARMRTQTEFTVTDDLRQLREARDEQISMRLGCGLMK